MSVVNDNMALDFHVILPTEMVFQILGFVEEYEDLLSTILVCKYWRSCVLSELRKRW
jgi:hypothetical protein